MNKSTVCGIAAGLAGVALAAQVPQLNHVPEKLSEDIRLISPKAAERNHVLIVNVGNAIAEKDFPTIVTYALSRICVNAWTNSIPESCWRNFVDEPENVAKRFGSHTTVAVFLERNERGLSFVNAPGHWSMVNLRGLDKDNPPPQVLRDRQAKMILKGIAHACGAGASVDDLCALNYNSFSLKGMDKTDIRISAMTYFPMLSTLQLLGGPECVSVDYE